MIINAKNLIALLINGTCLELAFRWEPLKYKQSLQEVNPRVAADPVRTMPGKLVAAAAAANEHGPMYSCLFHVCMSALCSVNNNILMFTYLFSYLLTYLLTYNTRRAVRFGDIMRNRTDASSRDDYQLRYVTASPLSFLDESTPVDERDVRLVTYTYAIHRKWGSVSRTNIYLMHKSKKNLK